MRPTARALARTYSGRVYPDPWEKVLDYRRVLDYAAERPNAGRVRVGNALDLPQNRVRGWLHDAIPDPVRGINAASEHGWLDPEPDGDAAAALVDLLAHVLAGGTIPERRFEVAVTEGRRVGVDEIRAAFDRVGVDTATRHDETTGRATEVVPATDASVLGRCLVTMGAPLGSKTDLDRLPAVVWEVPAAVRESFVRTYVRHRAAAQRSKATLTIREERPATYLSDLRRVITESTGEAVTASGVTVTISAAAARELGLA